MATGFDSYQPEAGELGYGIDGVLTLPQFKELVDGSTGGLRGTDRPVRSVAYVYCVGSRQPGRQRVLLAVLLQRRPATRAITVAGLDPAIRQYHLYRDIRTYGKFETLYTDARTSGSVFLKFPEETPPAVAARPGGGLEVTVTDLLTERQEIAIPVDLVVLVTGMVPRANEELVGALKLPLGKDGFFNEIHPKLRPVETVVDGVLIAGACQGPKTSGGERRLRPRRGDPECGDPAQGLRGARSARRGGARRRVHRLRRLPHDLPVRRDLHVGGRRPRRSRPSARPAASAAAAASRCVPRTPSTCAATPTPRSPR